MGQSIADESTLSRCNQNRQPAGEPSPTPTLASLSAGDTFQARSLAVHGMWPNLSAGSDICSLSRVSRQQNGLPPADRLEGQRAATRQVRALCSSGLVVTVFVALLAIWLAIAGTTTTTVSGSYDPIAGLEITLSGCDLEFYPSASPDSVSVYRYTLWPTWHGKTDLSPGKVTARSSRCNRRIDLSCRETCLVRISVYERVAVVPVGAGAIRVLQDAHDKSDQLLVSSSGPVQFGGELVVRGHSVAVKLDKAMLRGAQLNTIDGPIHMSALTAAEEPGGTRYLFRSVTRNVVASAAATEPIRFEAHQQSDGNVCILSDAGVRVKVAHGVAICDNSTVAAEYDSDSNGVVTKTEFESAVQSSFYWCCSATAPCGRNTPALAARIAKCTATKDSLFGTEVVLTVSELEAAIASNGDPRLIPGCEYASIEPEATATAAAPLNLTVISLESMKASVRVVITDPAGGGSVTQHLVGNRASKSELIPDDNAKLQAIGKATNGSGFNYVTIEAKVHPDLDPYLFVYVTNDVFLEIEPAYLELMGAWLLAPELTHVKVGFTISGDVCGAGTHWDSAFQSVTDIVHAYVRITEALIAGGGTGTLVRLSSKDQLEPTFLKLSPNVQIVNGEFILEEGVVEVDFEQSQKTQTIIALNLAIAIIVGVALTIVVSWKLGRKLIKGHAARQRTNAGARGNIDGGADQLIGRGVIKVEWHTNPFQFPMVFSPTTLTRSLPLVLCACQQLPPTVFANQR